VSKKVCETCWGDGVLIGDAVDARGNHIDEVVECPECSRDDYEEIEGEQLDALEKSFWHSLNDPNPQSSS
jgi:hypothetical protein